MQALNPLWVVELIILLLELTFDDLQHTAPQHNADPIMEITASINAKIAMMLPSMTVVNQYGYRNEIYSNLYLTEWNSS